MLDPRPHAPLPTRTLLLVIWGCVGAILLLLALSCATEPDGDIKLCGLVAAPGAVPPPVEAQRAAMEAGYAEAAKTCPAAAQDTFRPAIRFLPGEFWVANGYNIPGGSPHGICAAGACYTAAGEIWISLAEPERVIPLIRWESRNMAWTRNGCTDQSYRSNSGGAK